MADIFPRARICDDGRVLLNDIAAISRDIRLEFILEKFSNNDENVNENVTEQ